MPIVSAFVVFIALGATIPSTELNDAMVVRLTWQAPSDCPAPDHLEHRIARHLGRRVETAGEHTVASITGTIQTPVHDDALWTLELTIGREGTVGTRNLSADTCAELLDAAAFISAVALDPNAVQDVLSAQSAQIVVPAPPPAAAPPALETEDPAPLAFHPPPVASGPVPRTPETALPTTKVSAPTRSWGAIAMGIGAGFGAIPRTSLTLDLRAAWARRRARVEVGVQRGFATQTEIVDGVGGEFSLLVAHAAGCFVPRVGTLEFPLCGGARLGAISGEGIGPRVQPSRRAGLWGGIDGQIGVNWALFDVAALFVRGHAGLAPATYAFSVNSGGNVLELSRAYGTLLAGIEGRFGAGRPAGWIRRRRANSK